MKISRLLRLISASLFGLMAASTASGNDRGWFEQTQWEAFVSQAAIYTSDYNYLSRSDDRVSLDMWEAGLLLTTRVKDDLSFSAQVLARRVSEFSDEDIRVDYGFFSYPFYQTENSLLGVRFGRIRSSYGFYNETRDIPHTRSGIIMPQAIYFDMTRNSFYSADGVELYGYRSFGEQRLAMQLFFSRPIADQDEGKGLVNLQPKKFDGDKSILAKISYGSEFEGWRAAFTYYRPDYEADVRINIGVSPIVMFVEDDDASFYSENMVTSLEYNQLQWTITAEYLRHKFYTDIPVLGAMAENSIYEEIYYLQGTYRFNEQWETYLRVERSKTRNLSFSRTFMDDTNIGLTYRPDDHWLFRAEAHYIEGLSRLFLRDNEFSDDPHPYWNAVMFQVAYKW